MSKKMKKNEFAESTFISYIAIVASKVLGILYNIPFYSLIGDQGGFIYSLAYQIYALFLDISTSGIPTAISIVVGHYNSLKQYLNKEKAYKIGTKVILVVSVVSFVFMQAGAELIARFYLSSMKEGASIHDVAMAIRSVSFCVLIVPFLSIRRGYLQGHHFFELSSKSQVIEQFVRIIFALVGAYILIRVLHTRVQAGVYIALFGAFVGALLAFIYVDINIRRNKDSFPKGEKDEKTDETLKIVKKIGGYCATITLVSIASSVYNIVDTKLMLEGLRNVGYSDLVNQEISSLISSWVPKMTEAMGALAIAMTSSIAPHISDSYANRDIDGVSAKINKGISILILICIPLTVGIYVFAEPYFRLFYGFNRYGAPLLRINVLFNLVSCFTMVLSMALQSLDRGKKVISIVLLSIILNSAMDLPLIYLFDRIGLPAYLGCGASSIIAEVFKFIFLLRFISHDVHISYRNSLKVLIKTILPLLAMTVTIVILRMIWPPVDSRVLLLFQLMIYALAGVIVYGLLGLKNGVIQEVLGSEKLDALLRKLKF
ncbi:MAG: oligosaccharide flippase family protein [Erysipelotrichaceae bacterium]|nr:oligosaccharide flippase family protein [Erysipelotrichaceae bacterium]